MVVLLKRHPGDLEKVLQCQQDSNLEKGKASRCRFITRFLLIGLVFILLSMAVASILNIFYYIQFPENICDNDLGSDDSELPTTPHQEGQPPATPSCPKDLANELKFDCSPQGEVTQELCIQRGCCWSPTDQQSIPFCFYPSNYNLYSIVNISSLTGHRYNGVVAYMQLSSRSGYPQDVDLLKLVATFESRSRLRVKVTDALNSRYEVDLLDTRSNEMEFPVEDADYEFIIDEANVGFSVKRKATNEVLFSCVGVGGFIYANQFLQISSLLPSSNVYGIGEHQDSFRHALNWQRMALFAHDEVPSPGKNLYGSHPFYLAMENNGLSHGVFLKNSNAMDVLLQPAPAITFRILGGVMDFYFLLGPTPNQVIEQYTDIIGRPAMPPYWSLGFHLCRFNYGTLNRTREIWKRTRDAGIPFDVQWNDIDYMDTSKDFTYDSNKFAGLPEFVDELHSVGMHYVPIMDPGISNAESSAYAPYDDGIDMKVFVRDSAQSDEPFVGKVWNSVSTVWPDFTHPNATEYWTKQLAYYHDQVAYDGLWIDMNEPANFYSGTASGCPEGNQWDNPPYVPNVVGGQLNFRTVCMSAQQYAGLHYDVHNLYGFSETISTNFALKQIRSKRPFIISRSTFPGQGHFGGHWSGDVVSDWTNLRKSITSILNYNMFGIPMVGADICGFNGDTNPSLCQRWMELGAFYPFARNHNTDDAIDQDPVALGQDVVDASKKALNVRYTLLPYLYTLFWSAHARGSTVARPLFFEFAQDRVTYSIEEQFLWGPALMIVPVLTENTTEVTAYLPKGVWYDFYSRDVISSGGRWQMIDAPLDTIPLILRGGYILPTQAANVTTTLSRLNDFDLLVVLDETMQAEGELYWDDGNTIDTYHAGLFNHVRFEAADGALRCSVTHWNVPHGSLRYGKVSILGVSRPVVHVLVNGERYDRFVFAGKVLDVMDLALPLRDTLTISFH